MEEEKIHNENETETPEVSVKKSKKQKKALIEETQIMVLSKEKKEVPFNETIEKERKSLFSLYKKTSRTSTILMFVVVVVFIGAFIMYSQPVWGQPVCWTLIGLTLAALIAYFVFTKNLYPNASKKYFSVFWKETNEYIFNAPEFADCKIDQKERYVLPEVLCDRVYKNVIDSASRNIVHGLYKNKGFTFGELAYYIPGEKRNSRNVLFVGRHLDIQNDFHFEGRYIVNIKGEKDLDLPNDIEDLTQLISQNRFIVYGPENANAEKDLGKELLNNLKAIECSGSLVNVNIVFWAGHTAVYLSYDDAIAAIPFEKEIDVKAYEQLRKNTLTIFEILE